MNIGEEEIKTQICLKGGKMAVIDNVLKKIKKQNIKKVAFTVKISSKLNDDLEYICKEFNITKSQLIEEILNNSGISNKVNKIKSSKKQEMSPTITQISTKNKT